MNMSLAMIFAILALLSFAASAAGVSFGRISLQSLGLFLLTCFLMASV